MFELAFTGLYLGIIHLFSAPDHLAAILPLSLLGRKRAWKIGLIWGLGHLIGLLIIGILLYFFKSLINFHFLEHYGMLYISLLLIVIGVWIIVKSKTFKLQNIRHEQHNLSKITLGTGIFHGIFAVSHIYALAPVISMNNMQFSIYFGAFSVGSIISVLLFTSLIYLIPKRLIESENFFKKLLLSSGILTFIIGIVFVCLFFAGITAHAH